MKKEHRTYVNSYTHFTGHEIQGNTHYDNNKMSWYEIAAYTFGTLITLLAILDLFFPEVVTEVLSEVMMAVS